MNRWLELGALLGVAVLAQTAAAQEVRGVTKTEIILGMHTDLSGPAATYGVSSSNAVKMRFDEVNAGEIFGRHMQGIADDHVLELTHFDRKRIFNLGYFTWVEQQKVSLEDFERRRDQRFWCDLVETIPQWDRLIAQFNAEVGAKSEH